MNRRPLDYKINGQYSFCLDTYADVGFWHYVFDEMCLGVATCRPYYEPIEIGHQRAVHDPDHIEPRNFIKDSPKLVSKHKELTQTELHDYVKFRYPVKSLGTKLLLRTYNDYHDAFGAKHLAARNHDTPAMAHFPSISKWINNQNVFSQVGRILFFINERQTSTPIHTDYADMRSRKDQFIWINFQEKKRFFVLDGSGQKQYLKGTINTFDNASWHGSEPAEYSCFTLRVDGVFTDTFLDETGLRSHYETNPR